MFELATRQHGVISTRQLKELGYVRNSAAKAHRVGRLRRVHRGVYVVGHEDISWHGRCLAAVLAARPAVASHLSAGYLWGLLRYRPELIEVTTPTARRQRVGFRTHCSAVDPVDLTAIDRIPCTGLERTLIDLAPILSNRRLEKVIERAEELRIFDLPRLEGALGRNRRHHGVIGLRSVLAIYSPAPFTRSQLEKRFLELALAAGLPRPATGFNVAGYELDAYWPDLRFAVELDVFETHGTRDAFERDRVRQEDLKLAGVEMIRVTGARLDREPKRVMDRVATLLARRRREVGG